MISSYRIWDDVCLLCFKFISIFSGYSDIAIGLAGLFGFEFKENFNFPYCSKYLFLSSGEDGTFLLEHGLKSMYTYHLEAVDAGK